MVYLSDYRTTPVNTVQLCTGLGCGNKKRKHNNPSKTLFECDICGEKFDAEGDLRKHALTHVVRNEYNCIKCVRNFKTESELRKHALTHKVMNAYNCNKCDRTFGIESELREHAQTHLEVNEFNCNKCERKYSDMNKLRRHDWRSHREIECNICSERLTSRQDISEHRRTRHLL